MRFVSAQDYSTIIRMNKEIINTNVDAPVILYKMQLTETETNIYGEAKGNVKRRYQGVAIPCLWNQEEVETDVEKGTLDITQNIKFSFLRQELIDRNIYPEMGDIIEADNSYWEIDQANEIQLYAGQQDFSFNVSCTAHLARKVSVQLDRPTL